MGKEFDSQYTGLFAFGLVDLSLVTVLASYLWRVAINDELHMALRVTAGVVAAPVLLSKYILGLSLMLALSLPVYGYHQIAKNFSEIKTDPEPIAEINPEEQEHTEADLSGLSEFCSI